MTIPFLSLDLAVAPNPPSLIANLKLVTIPIDAYTCFELWIPSGQSRLMPEEALLLKDDYLRLEEICGKLVWLLGANLVNGSTLCNQEPIYDWPSLVRLLRQAGKRFDTVMIDYAPAKVCPVTVENGKLQGWAMNPATWNISFLEFTAIEQSYQVNTLPLSVTMRCGQPATRQLEVTSIGMRYL